MGQILVRNLDDAVIAELRRLAAAAGRPKNRPDVRWRMPSDLIAWLRLCG